MDGQTDRWTDTQTHTHTHKQQQQQLQHHLLLRVAVYYFVRTLLSGVFPIVTTANKTLKTQRFPIVTTAHKTLKTQRFPIVTTANKTVKTQRFGRSVPSSGPTVKNRDIHSRT
jgi:hypothetical protein